MTTNWLINEVAEITESNIATVKRKLITLSENQLSWKPNPASWSILEVLAHLNTYAEFYNPHLKTRISRTKFKTPVENFNSSPLGRSAWQSIKLGKEKNVKRSFNAPKQHNPSIHPEWVKTENVEDFLVHQHELLEIITLALSVNLRKVKIPISISKLVRLRLGDTLLFVAYHNQRHIEQINKILKNSAFPKK